MLNTHLMYSISQVTLIQLVFMVKQNSEFIITWSRCLFPNLFQSNTCSTLPVSQVSLLIECATLWLNNATSTKRVLRQK